ncbi:Hsp20/alpha crystallin family protein [Actinosynnema sp. NPDC023658]|uniref:Hsp20/alpha crystallin family protein n=1 Tax=Actinosynnema sp. NPDC023658 TaxID=3155465 RepID=UPI0033D340E9
MTVRRRVPGAEPDYAPGPDPVVEMDVWWDRIGRTLGRDWDLTTDDDRPLLVDVAVTGKAYFFATLLDDVRPRDVRVEVRDHDVRSDGTSVRRDRVGITVLPARRARTYYYCATVPAEVDVGRIDAWMLDGMVVVRVPTR